PKKDSRAGPGGNSQLGVASVSEAARFHGEGIRAPGPKSDRLFLTSQRQGLVRASGEDSDYDRANARRDPSNWSLRSRSHPSGDGKSDAGVFLRGRSPGFLQFPKTRPEFFLHQQGLFVYALSGHRQAHRRPAAKTFWQFAAPALRRLPGPRLFGES